MGSILDDFGHQGVMLDACCIINFCSSGQITSILDSLNQKIGVASYVYKHEVKNLHSTFNPLIGSGKVSVFNTTTPEEARDYVNFTSEVDDGESASAAIAKKLDWAIATDDNKARTVFARVVPQLHLLSTPEFIKHWAEKMQPSPTLLRDTIRAIHRVGHYHPNRSHPLALWWYNSIHLGSSKNRILKQP